MPCPFTTELARSLDRLHDAQKRAAKAAKDNPRFKREADAILILAHRAYNAALRNYEEAKKRNSTRKFGEAAE